MAFIARQTMLGALVLLASCGGGEAGGDGGMQPPCEGTHFVTTPTDWALPNLGNAWAKETFDRFSDGVNWGVLDLTGDGQPDLVVASGSGTAQTGTDHWLVFENTGSGFAAQSRDWALPNLGNAWANETSDRFSDGVNWDLVDLTGDGRLDLVVASGSGTAQTGTDHWLVFENTGSGFAAQSRDWALPNLGNAWAKEVFDRFSDGVNWSVIDLTGDRRPDLVVASGSGTAQTGTDHWLLFENTGSAFATQPRDWALPNLGNAWAKEVFDRFSDGVNWSVIDLTGDRRPDLVVASGSGTTGTDHWLLFENTGSAFATQPRDWALPNLGNAWAKEVFDQFSDGVNWNVLDLTGDRRPDLVVASGSGTAQTGTDHWLLFANTGSAFATQPADWPLPNLGNAWATETFDRFSDGVNFELLDLTGEGRADLVVASGAGTGQIGTDHWLLYENRCAE